MPIYTCFPQLCRRCMRCTVSLACQVRTSGFAAGSERFTCHPDTSASARCYTQDRSAWCASLHTDGQGRAAFSGSVLRWLSPGCLRSLRPDGAGIPHTHRSGLLNFSTHTIGSPPFWANKKSQPTMDTLLVYFSFVGSGSQAQAHAIVVDDGLLLTLTTQQRKLKHPRARSDWHKLLAALRATDPALTSFVSSYSFVLIIHAFPLPVKRPRAYSLLWFIRYTVLQARKKKDLI